METVGKKQSDWTVLWQEERRTLSLQGEPVLDYTLSRPRIQAGGQGGRRVDRYYQRLAEVWRRRWDRALYWQSCLDLARCRDLARSIPALAGPSGGPGPVSGPRKSEHPSGRGGATRRRPPAPGADGRSLVPAGGGPSAGWRTASPATAGGGAT